MIQKQGGKGIEVIAKIERKQAVENLDEIVEEADGVIEARGDMGFKISLTELPVLQQRILRAGARLCKPVTLATQMLEQ